MEKRAIVTTTIFVPKLLDAYAADAIRHGREILFVVIGDKKTPPETAVYCADLAQRTGFEVQYFAPERQMEYLRRFPQLRDHIPWNCIMRRNVGILYAYEQQCPAIATIDDDNFLITDDYLGMHHLDEVEELTEIASSTGWLNVCALLEEAHGRRFYHRGFPLEKRLPDESWKETKRKATPVVSAGLWLGDPDVDAIERLYYLADPTDATRLVRDVRITPAKGTWTPFNSQNTALARRVVPAYFLSPKVGRYDDIWAAYIVKRIADHLGDAIAFGQPLVKQTRNPHNYWNDLDLERFGQALTLRFVETLAGLSLSGADYRECYAELSESLPPAALADDQLGNSERTFLEGYFAGMRIWRSVFEKLG
jgi:hypothetical protein